MYRWNVQASAENTDDIVKKILEIRGLKTKEEQDIFLNPPPLNYWINRLPRNFIESLKKSKKIIEDAISKKMPIVVHGDYDVDGITATAILYSTLKNELGYKDSYVFIPNRFEHGYGLSDKSIDACLEILEHRSSLFITVDSGITSVSEVARLKKEGHTVIVTDHHQKPEVIPDADALLWNDQIVGASISWILSKALGAKNQDFLPYACLATVTDLQPLLNFNRSIVKYGLEAINNHMPKAFTEILALASQKESEVTSADLGWKIGPRLNASGRLGDASLSLQLLLESESTALKDKAWELNKVNSTRQDKTVEMYDLASDVVADDLPKIIVSDHEDYHEGIIGLVASRIVQQYNRPAIVISTSEKLAKGSVRSISGINIIEVLRNFEDLFESLGGHPMAAGFSIQVEKIPLLKKSLQEYSTTNIDDEHLIKIIDVDLEIPIRLATLELLQELQKLNPHGMGNPAPIFTSKKVGLAGASTVGRDSSHFMVRLNDEENYYKGIFFGKGELVDEFSIGDYVDIVYSIQENNFNGRTYLDLILKDITKSE